jgi:hypothetical protein
MRLTALSMIVKRPIVKEGGGQHSSSQHEQQQLQLRATMVFGCETVHLKL